MCSSWIPSTLSMARIRSLTSLTEILEGAAWSRTEDVVLTIERVVIVSKLGPESEVGSHRGIA